MYYRKGNEIIKIDIEKLIKDTLIEAIKQNKAEIRARKKNNEEIKNKLLKIIENENVKIGAEMAMRVGTRALYGYIDSIFFVIDFTRNDNISVTIDATEVT